MTPNGTWIEKGDTRSTRLDQIRRNKLLIAVVLAVLCMCLLAVAAGAAIFYYYIPVTLKPVTNEDPCNTVCSFGSKCLLDDETQQPYCMCRETCSDVFAPVCGDDDVTYTSECRLRVASCIQQRRILVIKQGSCEVPDPCETTECLFGSFCRPTFDGQTAQCVCPDKCPDHLNGPGAVCGTDGRNYPNICELFKISCREMRNIEVKFKGVCDPCEGVVCPTSQTCQLDDERSPVCRCNSVCSPDFRPVCGSDGKTYTNECTMRVAACLAKKNIRIIYSGECSNGVNPCDSLQCGPYQSCDIDHHGKATCHCDDVCEPAVRLVCGSDGQTYHNECEMKKQGCLHMKDIKLLYRGECGERGPCYQHHCSNGAICVVRAAFPTCECPICTEEFQPVCGSDGISYTNDCKLRREACEQKTELTISYLGLCTGCENKRCEYYAVCESDRRGNGKCVCPETCLQVESLVCGTDGVTYLNECEMRAAACRKAEYVLVVAKGTCDLCREVHCKYGARCEDGKCVCPTDCPHDVEVVCANDGTTYRNECEMRGAACRHDRDLSVLFYKECDDDGESHDEGSGMEADCHDIKCRYGGVCDYNSEGLPYCACSFRCPVVVDPVCGSDGRLHHNECRLKEEACRQQKIIMPVHIEKCEDYREVPCDGEPPLIDPFTNDDYYCGDKTGAKLCPPGSYCHRTRSFAKCCREVLLVKSCFDSTFGCCPDGITPAQALNNAGCPSVCNCNRLGSYGSTCDPTTDQCFCKPGVGGRRCDRCEPGYWGLQRRTDNNADGCSSCSCNLYGSVRDDCEQMTGRCVCKPGVQGMKCDVCPQGTVLGPDGCMDESIAQPVSGSCDELFCFYGAVCREKLYNMAQCVCETTCFEDDALGDSVCASDGNTYGSDCQLKLFACRYQKEIIVVHPGACSKNQAENSQGSRTIRSHKNDSDKRGVTKVKGFVPHRKESHLDGTILQRHQRNHRPVKRTRSVGLQLLQMPLTAQTGRVSLEIEFVVHQKDGILLYCGSEMKPSVYLLLLIRNQFLELWVSGLNESFLLRSPRQIEIGHLHHVSIQRYPHFVSIYLDKKWVAAKSCSEKYTKSTFPGSFVVGSVPPLDDRFIDEVKDFDFVGCISKLRIGKHDLSLRHITKLSSDGKYDKIKTAAIVKPATDKKRDARICFLNNKDHLSSMGSSSVQSLGANRTDMPISFEFRMVFRTTSNSTTLFTWKGSAQNDEMKIQIGEGRVELSLVCGSRRNVTIRNWTLVNDGQTHSVKVQKVKRQLDMFFDNTSEVILLHNSCSSVLTEGHIYILDSISSPNEHSSQMFRGCIQELYVTKHNWYMRKIARDLMCLLS